MQRNLLAKLDPRVISTLLLVLPLFVVPACQEGGGLQLLQVRPQRVPTSRPTEVEILGQGLDPCVVVNCGDDTDSKILTALQASAGGHRLADISWLSETRLTATMPAGLPPPPTPSRSWVPAAEEAGWSVARDRAIA